MLLRSDDDTHFRDVMFVLQCHTDIQYNPMMGSMSDVLYFFYVFYSVTKIRR